MKIYRYPSPSAETRLSAILGRQMGFSQKDYQGVTQILEDVKTRGDAALIDYASRFDAPGLTTERLQVTAAETESAQAKVEPHFLQALERAAGQIESFHRHQMPNSWIDTPRPGTMLGQMVHPVSRAGIYVPGGKGGLTPLVSSVLMGAIPAKIAGVNHITMVTPPMADGSVSAHLLVAAKKAGVDAIFKVGSAWAIAALAYGTETIAKVDVIVGPGNIFVTLAKKIVAGTVGIDMIAGPSEILVIADKTADSQWVAADMLSQAEHDALASAVLVTDSQSLAQTVTEAVDRQLEALSRKEIARASIEHFGGIFVVHDLDTALDLANRIAPEHLELQIAEPFSHLSRIRNAGAVFVGRFTPEPVGDYMAGPNHVLPTAGTARFSSALSVDHFLKRTSLLYYDEAAFRNEAADIVELAGIEGLDAHANSVNIRLR